MHPTQRAYRHAKAAHEKTTAEAEAFLDANLTPPEETDEDDVWEVYFRTCEKIRKDCGCYDTAERLRAAEEALLVRGSDWILASHAPVALDIGAAARSVQHREYVLDLLARVPL